MITPPPVRVLIVDDSAMVRQVLSRILSTDPRIQVIATASDPFDAAAQMEIEVPDVITLDVEMPRMNGITFLRKLMAQHPIPVVICSAVSGMSAEAGIMAMEAGAVEIIAKPKIGTREFLEESRTRICDVVLAAALCKGRVRPSVAPTKKLDADAVFPWDRKPAPPHITDKVVVIGASTGGTEALRTLLQGLPSDAPGIVIVQHMPPNFTKAFARRLNDLCDISVKEAEQGDAVVRGSVLVAPGDQHVLIRRIGTRYTVELRDGPLVCRQRPSVDVLFRSAAKYVGTNAVGVLLTGMGDDGARGMRELKDCGAWNIAQDEASSVVWGMPQEAVKLGCVDRILPLEKIPLEIVRVAQTNAVNKL